jgi:hypothetical protein
MNEYFFNSTAIVKAATIIGLSLAGQVFNLANATAAVTGTPLTAKERFEGKIDYVVTGGTLRSSSNHVNACNLKTSSTGTLANIPQSATVQKAYLYWSGSGAIDNQVKLNGNYLTADKVYNETYSKGVYFQAVKDVTNIVQTVGNGKYDLTELTVDSSPTYCGNQTVLSAWSMVVIYEDPSITKLNTINLYEGFKKSSNSSFDYTLAGIKVSEQPVAKYSVLAWEGDESLGTDGEYLKFNGTDLSDKDNPDNNLFNSSINSIGQGIDTTYGVDFDTFDVSTNVKEGQTSITGTVGTGQDLVFQGAALVMVTDDLAGQKQVD